MRSQLFSWEWPPWRAGVGSALIWLAVSGLAAQPANPPGTARETKELARVSRLAQAGREARDAGRYDEARELFAKAEMLAKAGAEAQGAAGDVATISRLRFDTALTCQLEGEARGNDPRFLERAILLYDQVLDERPGSAATLCNLARAYAHLGKWDLAEDHYRQAAKIDRPDQPFYLRKYADYLASRGDWANAVDFYEAVALARPQSTEAHEVLLAHYQEQGPAGLDSLLAYLWKLVDAGEGRRAAEAAIDLIEMPLYTADSATAPKLMPLVAAGLARSPFDPESFLASPMAKRLIALGQHPTAGQAALQLISLMRSLPESASPQDLASRLSWWVTSTPQEASEPAYGVRPEGAMRSLLVSLGRWHERRGQAAVAETHYRTAIILVPGTTDPGAARHLMELFISQNRLERLWSLLEEYQWQLFEAKGEAYRREELAKIYEFHTTLGTLYGFLASKGQRDWGTSSDPWSAIYQLERAVEVGRELDDQAVRQGKTPTLHLEPNIVEYLARGFDATDSTGRKKSTALRIDAAQRFKDAGKSHEAAVVLAPVSSEEIPDAELRRLRSVVLDAPETLQFDAETRMEYELEKQRLDTETSKRLEVEQRALDPEVLKKLEIERKTLDPETLKRLQIEREQPQPPPPRPSSPSS